MGDENIYSKPSGNNDPIQPDTEYVKKTPRPLTDQERARAMEQKRLTHMLAPEFIPVIREFERLGMIDGWRAVTVTPKEK